VLLKLHALSLPNGILFFYYYAIYVKKNFFENIDLGGLGMLIGAFSGFNSEEGCESI
jgi:hypothetical protein